MIAVRPPLFAAAAWLALAPYAALAHGLITAPLSGGEGVRVAYDNEEPVPFADVQVFAPGGGAKPVLTGVTDRNGCFLFLPDTAGVWRVSVDDGMGHAASRAVTSAVALAAASSTAPPAPPGRMSRVQAAATGLSLIFGVFGWGAWLRLRTRRG